MRHIVWCCALFALSIFAVESRAGAADLRQLDPANPEIWGTDDFQLAISNQGTIRAVQVKGKEVIAQALALYTFPVPPGTEKSVRCVQGEGFGAGPGGEQPKPQVREEDGKRIFEYDRVIGTSQILEGHPLCKVHEQLIVTPKGEIHVLYEFEWMETVRWDSFGQFIMFNEENCRDREYQIKVKEQFFTGKLDNGPITERQIRFMPFDQLTIRTDLGPVQYVWEAPSQASFYWATGLIQLHIAPPIVPTTPGSIFKGQKDRMAFRILLPVPQQ